MDTNFNITEEKFYFFTILSITVVKNLCIRNNMI